jgi:hypothetical protein
VASLIARVAGVVTSPRHTLTAVAARPRWAGMLVLTTLVAFACSALLLRTEVGQLALVDQWERTAIGFGGVIGDAEYARLQELSRQAVTYAAVTTFMSGPVLAFALAGVLTLGLRAVLDADVSFKQSLAVVVHAGVILALRQLIATPLQYMGETLASPTTLVRLAGSIDETSPLARFMGVIDIFVIWWIVVLAIGIAAATQHRVRPLAFAFAGVYIVLAVALALTMAMTGGTA